MKTDSNPELNKKTGMKDNSETFEKRITIINSPDISLLNAVNLQHNKNLSKDPSRFISNSSFKSKNLNSSKISQKIVKNEFISDKSNYVPVHPSQKQILNYSHFKNNKSKTILYQNQYKCIFLFQNI